MPKKSNSPSGTLQIRVFSSFTVSFNLPMIASDQDVAGMHTIERLIDVTKAGIFFFEISFESIGDFLRQIMVELSSCSVVARTSVAD